MNWNISKRNGKWELRKAGAKKATALFGLRREAIARARAETAARKGGIYVHGAGGLVVIRIPELPPPVKVAAAVWIKRAGGMTPKGRADIVAWLRKSATHLSRYGTKYASNFRARFSYYG